MIIREKTKLDLNLDFVKVVVDIDKKILSAVCELHIDCADELVADGSEWENLWGANVNLKKGTIVYTSMINMRPKNAQKIEIQDENLREKISAIITSHLISP